MFDPCIGVFNRFDDDDDQGSFDVLFDVNFSGDLDFSDGIIRFVLVAGLVSCEKNSSLSMSPCFCGDLFVLLVGFTHGSLLADFDGLKSPKSTSF